MPAYYELTQSDVGKRTLSMFGRTVLVQTFLGKVMGDDVGKRCFLRADGVVQVENDAQRADRLKAAAMAMRYAGGAFLQVAASLTPTQRCHVLYGIGGATTGTIQGLERRGLVEGVPGDPDRLRLSSRGEEVRKMLQAFPDRAAVKAAYRKMIGGGA